MKSQEFTAAKLQISLDEFRRKALAWAQKFNYVSYYNPNNIPYPYNGFEHFLAVSDTATLPFSKNFTDIRKEIEIEPGYLCGYISYDLKNQIEKLCSNNDDELGFPDLLLFRPTIIIKFNNNTVSISMTDDYMNDIVNEILKVDLPVSKPADKIKIQQKVPKAQYISAVEIIKEHILQGNVYEMNYCMEFFATQAIIEPVSLYLALTEISPTPFSGFLKFDGNYLLCASPERFLKKQGRKLISQPIKGTIKRGATPEEDEQLRFQLRHDEKELAENMMIVDLVRNDLSRSCAIGSVKVEEMFGTYGFRQVWQMISTVSGHLKPENDLVDALIGAFPMGSMTGAPKISAMQLIEELEITKRGLYSGAFGYITHEQDCDFNVVIRSIQYNSKTNYLSFMVGSAITYDSDAEKEYEECLLKAKAIMQVLGQLN
jgi:para-aminobenzoate synthetase component I